VPEGGWPLPGPIPSSYYSREALPRTTGFARARGRIATLALSLEGIQLPRLHGREPLVAAAAAVAVLMLGVIIGLAAHGSGSAPRGQTPGSRQAQAAAPASTSTPSTAQTPVPTTPPPTPTPTPTPTPSRPQTATPVLFVNGPLTAHPPAEVTLRVLTLPHTSCSIAVKYPSAPDLAPAQSGADGTAAWRWHVSSFIQHGTWPVVVACGTGTGTTQIVIT